MVRRIDILWVRPAQKGLSLLQWKSRNRYSAGFQEFKVIDGQISDSLGLKILATFLELFNLLLFPSSRLSLLLKPSLFDGLFMTWL
jgi:hypothetical protein